MPRTPARNHAGRTIRNTKGTTHSRWRCGKVLLTCNSPARPLPGKARGADVSTCAEKIRVCAATRTPVNTDCLPRPYQDILNHNTTGSAARNDGSPGPVLALHHHPHENTPQKKKHNDNHQNHHLKHSAPTPHQTGTRKTTHHATAKTRSTRENERPHPRWHR